MKLRKPLAILLVLALSLGVAPITGASGAIEGQSTTFQSAGTITQRDIPSVSEKDHLDDEQVKTIDVTVTNIYNVLVNPYGMAIMPPDSTEPTTDSIVTAPMYIENNTSVQVDVTATATFVPYGDVVPDSKPTRYAYEHHPLENPDEVPEEERVYLYMQMTSEIYGGNPEWPWEVDDDGDAVWVGDEDDRDENTRFDNNIITKDGGAGPLTVSVKPYKRAALQIFGNTSLPTYYGSWHLGNGFNVYIVLSFTAKQNFTVSFDAVDYWWDDPLWEEALAYDVHFLVDGKTYTLEKGYYSSGTPRDDMIVNAEQDLTFTIKTAEEAKGQCYTIRQVTLSVNGVPLKEPLYEWVDDPAKKDNRVQFTYTINASELDPGDEVVINVMLDSAEIK